MASNNVIEQVGSVSHQNLLILIWTCFSCAFLVVSLRGFVRWKLMGSHRPTADDCWTLLALTSLLALCILDTLQLPSLYYITAVLQGSIPLSEELIYHTQRHLRFQFPIVVLFWTVLWSVKAAFLALYFRLFVDLTFYRRVWYFLAVFTLLAYGGCITTLALSCGPNISNFFGFATCATPEHVWASNFSVYFSTIIDVFTDLCIMAMPLRLIYSVKVTWSQRLGLVTVFGLGFVMIAFAIVRANQVLVAKQFVNLTLLMVWSTLAASISVIVGTLPALKALITNRKKQQHTQKSNGSKSRSVRMGSLGSRKEKKSMGSNESQEEILRPQQPDDAKLEVRIKRDIVSTPSWPLPN
ncbi:hypothetical protein QBC42DRAFT_18817 [Cladorrhinum samala]|uniref:Rhodopsin domain-containing protein n=1 Tax=Cladorrhinum samala TaxID=585594 RepID=A0AAV9HZ55_9PEZI|nr:hypothetical protein QBC42DRAFT_18817 [Cladorrhinum samala]